MKRVIPLALMCLTLTGCGSNEDLEVQYIKGTPVDITYNTEVEAIAPESTEIVETVEIVEQEVIPVEFRVTAYCSCPICCGKWANKRPVDEHGNEIVIGASGERLQSGISVASPLQFGTEIDLDGIGTVVVQDRLADWVVDKYGEYLIDVYMDNHEDAKKFGVQYLEGVILNDAIR